MTIKRRMDNDENREFWTFVEETSKSVAQDFPSWKRGDSTSGLDCKVTRETDAPSQSAGQSVYGPKMSFD